MSNHELQRFHLLQSVLDGMSTLTAEVWPADLCM